MAQMFMYDSTNLNNVPSWANAPNFIIASYGDGLYANTAQAMAEFPLAKHITISAIGTPGMRVGDCEPGCIWPESAAAEWSLREHQAGRPGDLYCNIDTFTTLNAAVQAVGLHFTTDMTDPKGVRWWAAGYTGSPYLASGSVATQFVDNNNLYDISETNGVWPMTITPPAPGPQMLVNCVAGMATHTGDGYYLVQADGGVFTHGDAVFHGSLGGLTLNKPIVDAALTPSGKGYWLVGADGGVFCFGDATFHGSTANATLAQPVKNIKPTPTGNGYWLIAADGGVFTFGDAHFYGSGA
jgi:hypothetical protein